MAYACVCVCVVCVTVRTSGSHAEYAMRPTLLHATVHSSRCSSRPHGIILATRDPERVRTCECALHVPVRM
eukprot:15466642-Alexandrium_andersonii.AAC.1